MKISKLLTICIDELKREGDSFSSDKLMLKMLGVLADMLNRGDCTSEVVCAATAFRKRNADPFAFKNAFEQACSVPGSLDRYTSVFSLDIFVAKAEEIAKVERCNEIDLSHGVRAILTSPSNNVRSALKTAQGSQGNGNLPAYGTNPPGEVPPAGTDVLPVGEITKKKAPTTESTPPAGGCADDSVAKKIETLIENTKKLRAILSDNVFGQDYAINVVAEGYFSAELNSLVSPDNSKPKATFLFAGSPGCGKTMLAEEFSKALCKIDGYEFLRLDMSGYSDKEAATEFAGSDDVYKGAQAGRVTSFVAKNNMLGKKSIILFDEIEKAHITIIHLFLQILDAGTLHDRKTDEDVSFKDTIIMFTTNAGKQLYEDTERTDFSGESRKSILNALSTDVSPVTGEPFFPAAICSRFASGRVVMFNRLDTSVLLNIGRKTLEKKSAIYSEKTGVRVRFDENVFPAVMFAEGGNADARTMSSRAKAFFDNEILELLRLVSADKSGCAYDKLGEIVFGADIEHASEDIRALYRKKSGANVLVFASEVFGEKLRDSTVGADYNLLCADTSEKAEKILSGTDVDLVIIDIAYGKKTDGTSFLNIEDEESAARDFFRYIREKFNSLPVHFVETSERKFSSEEKLSFMKMGVKSIIPFDGEGGIREKLAELCVEMFRRNNMRELARTNKYVSYETAQWISEDKRTAYITMFDFKRETAVDAADSDKLLHKISTPNVKFDEIYGASDAKGELMYFVEYLKNPKKYVSTGVKAPKGVLLYGPPGTGKTMLAKAVAASSGVTFISTEGNAFLNPGKNGGAKGVHDIFATARKYAPSVLFIDEIDAIGKERTGAGGEDILTAFLTEMDGFKVDISRPVFVLAATNYMVEPGYAKSLDAALLRRFDRRILVDLPGKDDRKKYLSDRIAKNNTFEVSDEKIESLAVRSTGMSLASLESMLELALRSSIRKGTFKVDDEVLDEAFETFNYGETKKWDDSTLERVAVHESGHTLISFLAGEKPSYVTVVARGNHGGYMQHEDRENKPISTRDEILKDIRTSLAGRAAEIVWYGSENGITTGASGDLESATRRALAMICYYGMNDEFGLAVIDHNKAQSGELSLKLREAVNEILDRELKNAVDIITSNRHLLDKLVNELIYKNSLSGKDIEKIFS